MSNALTTLDWLVVTAYLAGIMGFAVWLSKRQHGREDYFVGGRQIGPWPVAISIMATQCSTNSILGAPAFVAFAAGGGLVWLQYELAVPLAMIVLMVWIMPVFRRLNLVSIYAYLEQRFDVRTRLLLSGLFLFVRAFATSVTVYSIAIVLELIAGITFLQAVLLLGAFTVIYDLFGGIRGVIYSDVIQLAILVVVLVLVLTSLTHEARGLTAMLGHFDAERRTAIDLSHHGLGDGHTFALAPMLIGGFFLYIAYYGLDQSQAQRVLSTPSIAASNQALFLNGLLRFPLVALYCLVGVGIGVFAATQPDFIDRLPLRDGSPELNLAVPVYFLESLPPGLVGLAMVALFAAAMSSLDSVINSLSATTMEDFFRRFRRQNWSDRVELQVSRGLTVVWGVVTLTMSFFVGDIAPTVLEAINKIGSLANGPILAVFLLGFFSPRTSGSSACLGLIAGIAVNAACWLYAPGISWLWWNPLGCLIAILAALAGDIVFSREFAAEARSRHQRLHGDANSGGETGGEISGAINRSVGSLLLWFLLLLGFLWLL